MWPRPTVVRRFFSCFGIDAECQSRTPAIHDRALGTNYDVPVLQNNCRICMTLPLHQKWKNLRRLDMLVAKLRPPSEKRHTYAARGPNRDLLHGYNYTYIEQPKGFSFSSTSKIDSIEEEKEKESSIEVKPFDCCCPMQFALCKCVLLALLVLSPCFGFCRQTCCRMAPTYSQG